MHILRQLAAAAAALYSLNTPVQSRALPSSSIDSRDPGCLAANCPDLVPRPTDHIAKREHTSISEGFGSIFERVPAPPRIVSPKPKPKPKPDSPTGKPGHTPSIPGDPKDVPSHIGSDAAPLPIGASKPGDPGPDLIGESKDPIKLKQKGGDVDKQAFKTKEEYTGDEIQKKFDDNYMVIGDGRRGTLDPDMDMDVQPAFKDLGVPDMEEAEYLSTRVFSKPNTQTAVAEGDYFSDKGIIIGESRFSDRDMNAPDQKLRPSDLTFLQWKASAGEGQVGSLRAFIGRTIISKSTVETMQKAQRDTRQALDQKATFERGADTAEKRDAFDMMMGTDFISSLGYMLKDHAPALGKKQISRIWCYPRTYDGTKGEESITITVNFEDVK